MNEFIDAIELFIQIVKGFQRKRLNTDSPLEEIALKTSKANLAYVDDRKGAKEEYEFDLWADIEKRFKNHKDFLNWINSQGVSEKILHSKSEQFPDFLFKVKKREDKLVCGSLLELKDSKGGSIASFNSTLPTKYKSLDEVDIINGNGLVSKLASIIDGELASDKSYRTYPRRSFYLIRTYKDSKNKVKISIVDGSFFETVPKEALFYQMFLNILRNHLEKKEIKISSEQLQEIEKSLSYITDQTIIAASQTIEKASIRPRLRIMAEVHTEGNPHGGCYPEITKRTVNLILQSSLDEKEVKAYISERVSAIDIFTIQHKRNGKHIVFQFKL